MSRHSIQHSVDKTREWLKEFAEELQLENEDQSLQILKACLVTLRDRLLPDEAANLSAQLPIVLRGYYFEGWKPSRTPSRVRNADDFVEYAKSYVNEVHHHNMEPDRLMDAFRTVLTRHISEGELRSIDANFSDELKGWLVQKAA